MANSWVKMGTPTVASGGGASAPVVTKTTINTEIVLYDYTLPSDASNFVADLTTNPLYSSCKDLRIVTQLRSIITGAVYAYASMRPNSAANNSGQFMQRFYTRGGGTGGDNIYTFYSEHATGDSPTDSYTMGFGFLPDFNHATKRKFIHHTSAGVDAASGAYQTGQEEFINDLGITAPITDLELVSTDYSGSNTGTFKAGSRLTIYGTISLDVVTDVT